MKMHAVPFMVLHTSHLRKHCTTPLRLLCIAPIKGTALDSSKEDAHGIQFISAKSCVQIT